MKCFNSSSSFLPFYLEMLIFSILYLFTGIARGIDWYLYDDKYVHFLFLRCKFFQNFSHLIFMTAMDKPMNWQDNKDYCKRLDSSLIFLSDREKSKFLRNKMTLILEKNQFGSLTVGQSLGHDHTFIGWIFIG